jgi:hypothetical protein
MRLFDLCCLSCACAQCIIHKHTCPEVIFDAQRAVMSFIKEKERLDRDERKRYMLDKLKSLKVRVTTTGKYFFT